MNRPEQILDDEEARSFLLQGLWLARVAPVNAGTVVEMLRWVLLIAADGHPVPPSGFVGDLFQLARNRGPVGNLPAIPGLDPTLMRRYEDYVVGKFDVDSTFERATEAVLRYDKDDQERAVAYLVNQVRRRAAIAGYVLNPAIIKSLMQRQPQELLDEGWHELETAALSPRLIADYQSTIDAVRLMGDALGLEDIFELERGIAVDEFSQRMAMRQIVTAASELEQNLPRRKPPSTVRHHSVATNIAEEDYYPVGGYSSLSNRGTIESLLRSELMYIDRRHRPDLFDIKYARDELLYYSRDENQFFRQRQTFVFGFAPDLITARFKTPNMPWQRIVLILATVLTCYRKLLNWLGDQSLSFGLVCCQGRKFEPLHDEQSLLGRMFQDEIAAGQVQLLWLDEAEFGAYCDGLAKRNLTHACWFSVKDSRPELEHGSLCHVRVPPAGVALEVAEEERQLDEDGLDRWTAVVDALLRYWV